MASVNKLHFETSFEGVLSLYELDKEDPRLDVNCGVYIIWYPGSGASRTIVYIGQVAEQPVRERLKQHLTNCHNDVLRDIIATQGDNLRFCFKPCPEDKAGPNDKDPKDQVVCYEKQLIEEHDPEANRIHRRK